MILRHLIISYYSWFCTSFKTHQSAEEIPSFSVSPLLSILCYSVEKNKTEWRCDDGWCQYESLRADITNSRDSADCSWLKYLNSGEEEIKAESQSRIS